MAETTAQATEVIHAPASEVWDALTDPQKVKTYFMNAEVKTDWKEGSPITWSGEFKGMKYSDKGELQEVRPQRRLSFSHYSPMSGLPDVPESYHLVTIDLTPTQSSTQVTLTQSNLTGGVTQADRERRAEFEKAWQAMLGGLKDVVEKH